MKNSFNIVFVSLIIFSLLGFGCRQGGESGENLQLIIQDSTDILFSIEGLNGPEAVRYAPNLDVYFVANWNGGGNERNSNGFISKVDAKGEIIDIRYITGTEEYPLHAPRGMYTEGDTLWVADVDGIHGFNYKTAEQLIFISLSDFEPGFINDITAKKDGHLYITDTGKPRIYQIKDKAPFLLADSLQTAPNGITYNTLTDELVIAPWGGDSLFYKMPADKLSFEPFLSSSGGYFDGIEFSGNDIIVASQADSSIRYLNSTEDQVIIKTPGRPADIGIDTKRNHIAVPYIALDRVDVWKLQ